MKELSCDHNSSATSVFYEETVAQDNTGSMEISFYNNASD